MHKRTVIAFVVFVALLGVVMATIFKPQERNISRLSVPAIAAETVEKIVVDRAETYELVKEGEYWVLDDGRPADDAQIDRALESVGTLTSTELVSSNPAKHATYEVDDETGSRVTIFVEDQPVLDFVIGKKAKIGGTYLRLADSDDVFFLRRSPIASHFVLQKSQWQRLELFNLSLDDVASLKVRFRDGSGFDIVPDEDKGWTLSDTSVLPDGFRFDGSKARSLVSAVLNLRAREILVMSPDPSASGLGINANVDTYTLALNNGVTHTFRLGTLDADEENYYAQLNEDQFLLIRTFAAAAIQRQLNDFRALNLMEFDPSTVTRLSITSKRERRIFDKTDDGWAVANDSAQPPTDFALNSAVVERSIQDLSGIRGTSYIAKVPTPAKAGFRKAAFEIAVTLEADETATLLLGDDLKEGDTSVYYARGNADSGTYLVPERAVAQFTASGFDRWN